MIFIRRNISVTNPHVNEILKKSPNASKLIEQSILCMQKIQEDTVKNQKIKNNEPTYNELVTKVTKLEENNVQICKLILKLISLYDY